MLVSDETWLRDIITNDLLSIDGYKLLRYDRPGTNRHNRGGGVCVYIRESYDAEILNSLPDPDGNLEFLGVRITREHWQSLTCITIYRPPKGDTNLTLKTIYEITEITKQFKGETVVHGNFNVNYANKKCRWTNQLKEWEAGIGLSQVIKEPTRVGPSSSSLIDLCFSDMKFVCLSGVINANLSDHLPTFILKKKDRETYSPCKFRGRSYKNLTPTEVKRNMHLDLAILSQEDPNKVWESLERTFVEVADIVCPIKSLKLDGTNLHTSLKKSRTRLENVMSYLNWPVKEMMRLSGLTLLKNVKRPRSH